MLARWLDRDGIGQMLAPDEVVAKEPVGDDKNNWFWQIVAPDPKFDPIKAPPEEAFLVAKINALRNSTVACQHCGKQTSIASAFGGGAVVPPLNPQQADAASTAAAVPDSPVVSDTPASTIPPPAQARSSTEPVLPVAAVPETPQPSEMQHKAMMLQTPSPGHPITAASGAVDPAYSGRPYKSDSAIQLEQLVLSAAMETARSMHSPPNQAEQRNKIFRICGNHKPLNDKLSARLRKLLTNDPTLLNARATHLGMLVPDGYTCFMAAAHAGNVEAANIVLDVASAQNQDGDASITADVEMDRDLQGRTALHIAAEMGHVEIVELLQARHDGDAIDVGTAIGATDETSKQDDPATAKQQRQKNKQMQAPLVDLLGRTPFGRVMTSPNPKARKKQRELEQILFSPVDSSIRGVPNPLSERVGADMLYRQLKVLYGIADMPGMRVTMEDAISTASWKDPTTQEYFTLLGVCDGHGDHGQVSKFIADTIPNKLRDILKVEQEVVMDNSGGDALPAALDWQAIWTKTCMETDMLLRQAALKGGSTGVFALITEKSIIVANVGDSRSILVQSSAGIERAPESIGLESALEQLQLGAATVAGDTAAETNYPEAIDQDEPHLVNEEGSDEQQSADDKPAAASNNDDGADSADGINVIPMSFDHKPDKEAERIENAGLKVQESRFIDENEKELVFHKIIRSNGDQLAVSRAFGDFEYKTNKTLGPEEQAVIAVPDVKIHPRNVQVDLYLVLACDGIWDVMSNVEVGKYVSQEMDAIKTQPRRIDSTVLPQVGDALLSTCLDKGSRDNMSVVLVALNQGAEPLAPISESSGGDDDAVKTLSFA